MALVGATAIAMSYQHCGLQKFGVEASCAQVVPPSVVLYIASSAPDVLLEVSAMLAYTVVGLEGASAIATRPAGAVPAVRTAVHVKPASVDL